MACFGLMCDQQSWGGGSDSYFEYLIKWARLSNTDNNIFADAWAAAVDSSIQNLARVSVCPSLDSSK